MAQKGKLPPEEKIKIVKKYLAGRASVTKITEKHRISEQTFRDWVRLYETRGAKGLTATGTRIKISEETKIKAVTDYLQSGGSQEDICRKYDISSRGMLQMWIKRYNSNIELSRAKN